MASVAKVIHTDNQLHAGQFDKTAYTEWILIICVVGAILFWVIDRFVRDARLGNLLKILVVLVCLGAILQRVLPFLGVGF